MDSRLWRVFPWPHKIVVAPSRLRCSESANQSTSSNFALGQIVRKQRDTHTVRRSLCHGRKLIEQHTRHPFRCDAILGKPVRPGTWACFQMQQARRKQIVGRLNFAIQEIWGAHRQDTLTSDPQVMDTMPIATAVVQRRIELTLHKVKGGEPS